MHFTTGGDKLAKTRAEIAGFANNYGLLGKRKTMIPLQVIGDTARMGLAEPYDDWSKAISDMKKAVDIYDALLEGNKMALQKLVYIRHGGKCYRVDGWIRQDRVFGRTYWERPTDHMLDAPILGNDASRLGPAHQDRYSIENIFDEAWGLLQMFINERLAALTHVKLLWNYKYTERALHIVPVSLWGAMWLQFATDVASLGEAILCKMCDTRFVSRRPKTKYCSNACKQKAYRKQKNQR